MTHRDERIIEGKMEGESYSLEYRAWDASYDRTTTDCESGDFYSYTEEHWEGWMTVRGKVTGSCLAACELGICKRRGHDDVFRRLTPPQNLAPGMEAAYADFVAKKVIAAFTSSQGRGIPTFHLIQKFDDSRKEEQVRADERQELLEMGLILDVEGQRMLALKE